MTPPTPAAVRAAMTYAEIGPEMHTVCTRVLRDHIRAVCAEMRKEADHTREYAVELALEKFADRLEGRES